MKTFRRNKKRKFISIKRAIGLGFRAWALRYGRINPTIDLPINSNQVISRKTASIAQNPKIKLIRTKSDLINPKWIKKFICEIRCGGDESDEKLIRSILSITLESHLDIPSINKILKNLAEVAAEVALEIATNDKLLRI